MGKYSETQYVVIKYERSVVQLKNDAFESMKNSSFERVAMQFPGTEYQKLMFPRRRAKMFENPSGTNSLACKISKIAFILIKKNATCLLMMNTLSI